MKSRKILTGLVAASVLLGCSGCSSTKTDSKGNDIVASIKGKNFTADDIYNDIYDTNGASYYYAACLQAIIDQKFPVDDDIQTDADTIVSKIKSYYKSTYGDDSYKSQLKSALSSSGYSSISAYKDAMIQQIQYSKYLLHYVDNNFDTVFNDYYNSSSPRILAMIKISVSDTSSLTTDEQSKVIEVQNLLATNKSFGDIAKDYSDDDDTKNNQGSLGVVDSTTGLSSTYGDDIETNALALNEGEVSGAITGTDGIYFLKCTSTSKSKIKKELKNTDIDSPLISYDSKMQYKAFKAYKFKYASKKVKKKVDAYITEQLNSTSSDTEAQ